MVLLVHHVFCIIWYYWYTRYYVYGEAVQSQFIIIDYVNQINMS